MLKKALIALGIAALIAIAFGAASGSGGQLQSPVHDPHKAHLDHVGTRQVPIHSPDRIGPARGV